MTTCSISGGGGVTGAEEASLQLTLTLGQVKFVQPNLAVVQGWVHLCVDDLITGTTGSRGYLTTTASPKEPCHVFLKKKADVCKLRRELFGGDVESSKHNTSSKTGRWVEFGNSRQVRMQFRTTITKTIERNRRGVKLLECDEVVQIVEVGLLGEATEQDIEKEKTQSEAGIPLEGTSTTISAKTAEGQFQMHDKKHRHALFAQWLVAQYGIELLSRGSGVLDVAGGKGELSEALLEAGVSSVVLLDPEPRILQLKDSDSTKIHVMAHALEGDGASLWPHLSAARQEILRNCSVIVGMHPDQATEAIIDFAQTLNVPFAMLPCCVMPSLFPRRMHQGQPVRSYRTFCQYLLHKHDRIQVHYLPFMGRNMILFHHK